MGIQIKEVNETYHQYSATITWKYDVGMYTAFYGDHDRLLTGNSMGAYWDSVRSSPGVNAQAQIREVTPDKEVAWELSFHGNNSETRFFGNNGWSIYSAERFYEQPVVSVFNCTA